MRLSCTLITWLVALHCADGAVGSHAIGKRQDTTAISTTAGSSSVQASSSVSSSGLATSSNDSPSSTQQPSSVTSAASNQQQSSTVNSSPVTTSLSSTTSDPASGTSSSQSISASVTLLPSATATPEQLPIHPKITPALGIAGVILFVAGVALCLVGIKHKWLHIFLSTALLAGLAVTVLIIYVMNPPVSDAIQGAYMVAAVVTGVVFGALAMVFKEVTEGLGCLLGGFCLAMWFLVLSPGGLVTSTSGKVILIIVFCIAFFALSFSHYTRNYGLIFCTSFAGAQIAIIGIDCFSRAGLKEFWLFLWNLNQNEFPINTTTYPITRGIRVEIAVTVIIFIFGIMSQLKIWKIVKERKAKRDAERMRDEEDRDQLESAVGRDIEDRNELDRAQWERVYGDKNGTKVHVDSGVGSSIESFAKHSASIHDRGEGEYEMAEMPGVSSKRVSKETRPVVTVRVASDESEPQGPSQSAEHLLDVGEPSGPATRPSTGPNSGRTSSDDYEATSVKDWSGSSTAPAGPAIVPLPFSIPGAEGQNEDDQDSDRGSLASRGTAGLSVLERRGVPLRHLALREKGLEDPHVEDDRASSVAATADEDVDADAPRLSQMPSPYQLEFNEHGQIAPADGERDRSLSPRKSMFFEKPLDEEDEEAVVRPETATEEPKAEVARASSRQNKRRSTTASQRRSIGSRRSTINEDAEEEGDTVSLVRSLKDHLPQKMSKVAMTYRTNEWAKHIAEADMPDAGDVSGSNSPGIQVDHAFAEEAAKPVDVEALNPAAAPKLSRNESHASSRNPYRRSIQATPTPMVRSNSGTTTPIYAFQRSSSQMSLNRQGSNATAVGNPRLNTHGLRNASAPLATQPLVESPIEDALAASGPYRNVSSPLGMASVNNLMDERNNRLKRKPTSTSFNALASALNVNVVAPSDSASAQNVRLDDDNISLSERKQLLDEENMTLAQRRALMQQQREAMQSPTNYRSESRQGTWPGPGRMNSTSNHNNLIFDSHQPKRTNTVDTIKQSNMLTQWRQSLQQEAAARKPLLADEGARQAMLQGRAQADLEAQRQQSERVNRESVMDMAMRSGQLHGAHRDALRRMQAQANNRAPQ